MLFSKPRGTMDLFGEEVKKFKLFQDFVFEYARVFNFKQIMTPIFESRELFTKAVGDDSDIVHKEFYDFKDKGNRDMALRPEGTAGVIRAVVENKMIESSNYLLKLFYFGPMFRYDRPQSGRQRQFHQFGVECIGNYQINDEVQILLLAESIINGSGIRKFHLEINNIGSSESRKKWIDELKKYFSEYKDQLSSDSLARLDKNPLRILDDKEDGSKDFVRNAPKLDKFLSEEEKRYFDQLKLQLDFFKIKYIVNNNLIRGLDYYSGLVFEFISDLDKLKGQSTLIGGGGYNSLVAATGGKDVPGIGFGLGVERMILAISEDNPDFFSFNNDLDIAFAPLSAKAFKAAALLQDILRLQGYSSDMLTNTFELKKHFKFAQNQNTKFVFILGDKEVDEQVIVVKDQSNIDKEEKIKINEIVDFLKKKVGDYSVR